MKEIEFNKEKISSYFKVSKQMISEFNVNVCYNDIDVELELATIKIDAYFYDNLSEKKELIYYCDRPTFTDWLFRRKRKAIFTLDVKDILLNPPKLPERTTRLYIAKPNY